MFLRSLNAPDRRSWFQPLLQPEDNKPGGAANEPAPDTKPSPETKPDTKPGEADDDTLKALDTLTPDQKKAVEERMATLEATLRKEREQRKALEKEQTSKAEQALAAAEANVRKALEEGKTAEELQRSQEELKRVTQELAKHRERDIVRDSLKAHDLGDLEDVVLEMKFGKTEEFPGLCERLRAKVQSKVADGINSRLPDRRPPGTVSTTPAKPATPDYGYAWGKQKA